MEAPRHIWRWPTGNAIDKLAERFDLPPNTQDWEYIVSDPERIDEFLEAYEHAEMSDDEKFTLMVLIIDSFNKSVDQSSDLSRDPRWQHTLTLLDKNFILHSYTIWYWSRLDAENEDEMFYTSPFIRRIFEAHCDHFAEPDTGNPS